MPKRKFQLAPHHRIVDIPPWHRFGVINENGGFKLLRDPQGRPVARKHSDLRPGEISLVLE